MPEFHETGYGRRFFDHQLPVLTDAINRLADAMNKSIPEVPEAMLKSGQMSMQAGPHKLTAKLSSDSEYPGTHIEVDGKATTAIEHCLGDGENPRTMIRIWTPENDQCISVNWHTGEVILPSGWQGEIRTEGET